MSTDLEDGNGDVSEQIGSNAVDTMQEHTKSRTVSKEANPSDRFINESPPSGRPPGGYTSAQRRFHWIVAGLVFVQLVLGLRIGPSPKHEAGAGVMSIHLIVGSLIFVAVLMRRRVRDRLGAPPPPTGTPVEAAALARLNHQGFYVLLLALPIFGWLAYASRTSAGEGFGAIHSALAIMLVLAICAHLSGVMYHTYVRRDGLLNRMRG